MSITIIPKVIFLMGPTASGKTLLSIRLREVLPVELISVDSALIYKGLDISTAKPNTDELRTAPLRLINIIDPAQTYSVANFYRDVLVHMSDIIISGRIPLLVGGTMLYFKTLLTGLSPLPSADYKIRAKIKQQAIEHSWSTLHKQLRSIDPSSAAKIHPNDAQRISRALEVFFISGKTLTELTKTSTKTLPYQVYQFAIAPENRELLYMRIEQRFHQMLAAGFKAEIQTLFNRGDLHANMPSIRCIGCRQMWSYLKGDISYDEMIYQGICATRQLAKRQMTWLRSWDNVHWLNSEKPQQALNKIQQVVSGIANCDIYNNIVLCLLFLVL